MTSLSTHLNDKELWKIDKDEVAYYGHMVLDASLEKLIDAASSKRDKHWGNVITYSRKIFVPLTNMCRDTCSYCTFVKHPDDPDAKIYNDDVEPVMMDEDEAEKPRVEKPSSEVLSPSLLSRIETELTEKLSKENK